MRRAGNSRNVYLQGDEWIYSMLFIFFNNLMTRENVNYSMWLNTIQKFQSNVILKRVCMCYVYSLQKTEFQTFQLIYKRYEFIINFIVYMKSLYILKLSYYHINYKLKFSIFQFEHFYSWILAITEGGTSEMPEITT